MEPEEHRSRPEPAQVGRETLERRQARPGALEPVVEARVADELHDDSGRSLAGLEQEEEDLLRRVDARVDERPAPVVDGRARSRGARPQVGRRRSHTARTARPAEQSGLLLDRRLAAKDAPSEPAERRADLALPREAGQGELDQVGRSGRGRRPDLAVANAEPEAVARIETRRQPLDRAVGAARPPETDEAGPIRHEDPPRPGGQVRTLDQPLGPARIEHGDQADAAVRQRAGLRPERHDADLAEPVEDGPRRGRRDAEADDRAGGAVRQEVAPGCPARCPPGVLPGSQVREDREADHRSGRVRQGRSVGVRRRPGPRASRR